MKFLKKKPIILFVAVLSASVLGAVLFIQSPYFARILTQFAQSYIPQELGGVAQFRRIDIQVFPPGVSFKDPHFKFSDQGSVQAERVSLSFYPLQMLSGEVRIEEIEVYKGNIDLVVDPKKLDSHSQKAPQKNLKLRWKDLFQFRAKSLVVNETKVKLSVKDPQVTAEFSAARLYLIQKGEQEKAGYVVDAHLKDFKAEYPKKMSLPTQLEQFVANVEVYEEQVKLNELRLKHQEFSINAEGVVQGHVLNPEKLLLDSKVHFKGEIGQMLSYLKVEGAPKKLGGNVEFSGNVKTNLIEPENFALLQGSLTGRDLFYEDWTAEDFSASGKWTFRNQGRGKAARLNQMKIEKITLKSPMTERSGGFQSGGGGAIEIGAFSVDFNQADSVQVPIRLSNAHLHWIGAGALASVYPLNVRLSGGINATWTPPSQQEKDWKLLADLDIQVPHFQLDNQRLNKNKKLRKLFSFPDLSLKGPILVNPQGLFPQDLQVGLTNTELIMTGKVDFKTGYALRAKGQADLSDFGTLSENEVRGVGLLGVSVDGPSSGVLIKFDTQLRDSFYLNLFLGDLNGEIVWDDGVGDLHFNQVQLAHGESQFVANGKMELGSTEKVDVDFRLKRGGIEDLNYIFQNFTKDLWWFPTSLTGEASGLIHVGGKVNMDELEVTSQLNGTNWDFYGEKISQASVEGGYIRGDYVISKASLRKYEGHLSGNIKYTKRGKVEWALSSKNLSLNDFNHLARLDVPIRGWISIKSAGSGPVDSVDSRSVFRMSNIRVRGVSMAPSEVSLHSKNGLLLVNGTVFGGQGTLDAGYDFNLGGKSYLKAEAREFDFSPIILLLNSELIQDPDVRGKISGALSLEFLSGKAEYANGKFELSQYDLAKTGSRFQLVKPISSVIDEGSFKIDQLMVRGPQGEVRFHLESKKSLMKGALTGELDLSAIEFLTPTIQEAAGTSRLNVLFAGSLKEPIVQGTARLKKGFLKTSGLDSPFENTVGLVEIDQGFIRLRNIRSDLATGRVYVDGSVELFVDRYPEIKITSRLEGNKVKVFPFEFAKVRGKVDLTGSAPPYRVTGDVIVDSALSTESVLNRKRSIGLKSARFQPPANSLQQGNFPLIQLAVNVQADDGILIKNDLFDAEMAGKVKIINTLAIPRVLGSAQMLKGNLVFKDRVFSIQSADIQFDNPAVINPKVDLVARTEVESKKIQMFASGYMETLKIEFSSDPVLPEGEILSLLALGYTESDLNAFNAEDRAAVEQGGAASLILQSFDFNRDVKNKTGFEIQLNEAVDNQTGASVFRPQGEETSAAAPKITVKRKIGKNIEVSVGSTVGVGSRSQKEVNAEVKVTKGVSVIGVWNSFEESTSTTDESQSEEETSFGVDLKFEKRFR